MDEFTLKLTKDECRQLLRHVYIANWILTATKDIPDREFEDFNQTVLKFLKTNNIESRIEKDKKRNMYFVDEDLEGEFLEEIEDYNEDMFIEELIDQLTKKGLSQRYSEEELTKMNEVKFNKAFDEIQARYIDEIENNGIRNIDVIAPAKEGA